MIYEVMAHYEVYASLLGDKKYYGKYKSRTCN